MKYDEMNKTNTSLEDYEKACYERAKKEFDPQYAKEGLDFAKELHGIESFYRNGDSVEHAVYCLCY